MCVGLCASDLLVGFGELSLNLHIISYGFTTPLPQTSMFSRNKLSYPFTLSSFIICCARLTPISFLPPCTPLSHRAASRLIPEQCVAKRMAGMAAAGFERPHISSESVLTGQMFSMLMNSLAGVTSDSGCH